MLVLGIETSTPVSSVVLGSEQGLVASMSVSRGRGHAEFLTPAIRQMCEQAELSLSQLAGVAVGIGPGLFTGMRVGIATAKALAQSLSIPIVGIPSLDLLAYDVRYTSRTICAAIDARRGEVFSAFYKQVPGGIRRISDYHVESPERLAGELEAKGEEILFVGNGALAYRTVLPSRRAEYASIGRAFPSAVALLELALPRFMREETDSVHELEPMYLRKADVQIGWETRGVVSASGKAGARYAPHPSPKTGDKPNGTNGESSGGKKSPPAPRGKPKPGGGSRKSSKPKGKKDSES